MTRDHQRGDGETSLPPGWPSKLDSLMVWQGSDISMDSTGIEDEEDKPYLLLLTENHLAEIDSALRQFQALCQPLENLCPSTFPLPNLQHNLRYASENIHSGYGFTLVRGLPVERYNPEENMIIYLGLSSHIAAIRGRQDHFYEGRPADVMVSHITDMRDPSKKDEKFSLIAYTDDEVEFHNDVGDIVSLFVLDTPASGGESLVASLGSVYNELANTRPDLIRVLSEDWPFQGPRNANMVSYRPLLFHQPQSATDPERMVLQFSQGSFSGFRTHSPTGILNPHQLEALGALQDLAKRFSVKMQLAKGDIQFINNFALVHARNSYRDDSTNKRHLLRLWLRDPQCAWPIPEQLRLRSERTFDQPFSNGPQIFPLEPVLRTIVRK